MMIPPQAKPIQFEEGNSMERSVKQLSERCDWLQRQLDNVKKDCESWSDWKRNEVGLPPKPVDMQMLEEENKSLRQELAILVYCVCVNNGGVFNIYDEVTSNVNPDVIEWTTRRDDSRRCTVIKLTKPNHEWIR